ncbi:MAG: DUF3179 domain-containing protein [Actinomycetota bacterium]
MLSRPSHRLVILALLVALVAAACAGSDEDDAAADAADDTAVDAPSTDSGDDGDQPDASANDAEPADLISPTETDAPFDLSGGVASGTGEVSVVDDDPQGALGEQVRQATEPWTTDWTRQTVDIGEFQLGIPSVDPRDRIPPIDTPKFEPATAATWLDPREPGALVQFNGETRFYPLSIMTRHEIVNDRYGDIPVAVTYCPLCNTAITFDSRVDNTAVRFGVSGLLRNSDLVMWDEGTLTLWQQLTGEALVGEWAGTQLEVIPTAIASYGDVVENFPDALSLARDTGFDIEYGTNSYVGYSSSPRPFLFDEEPDPRFPALSRVVGVSDGTVEKAYPFSVLTEVGAVNDTVGDLPVAVLWGGDTADALDAASIAASESIGSAIAYDRRVDGQELTFSASDDDQFVDAETGTTWTLLGVAVDGPLAGSQLAPATHRNEFWFAWAAFFPDAEVYEGA